MATCLVLQAPWRFPVKVRHQGSRMLQQVKTLPTSFLLSSGPPFSTLYLPPFVWFWETDILSPCVRRQPYHFFGVTTDRDAGCVPGVGGTQKVPVVRPSRGYLILLIVRLSQVVPWYNNAYVLRGSPCSIWPFPVFSMVKTELVEQPGGSGRAFFCRVLF